MERVYITGAGILTSLGDSFDTNRNALVEGKCGIGRLECFSTKYADSKLFGEIKLTNDELKAILNVSDIDVSRTSLLALHAFKQAIADANLTLDEVSNKDTALILATTVGGMCLIDELYHDANAPTEGSPYLSSYDCGSIAIYLQKKYKIGGIINTINTACSSSTNAIMYGAQLLKKGLANRVIVGGVDSLAKFTINGFNSLHILSSELCAPFDANRNGLNLGEGAGFLVLEGEKNSSTKKRYAEVKGYANANDAFHPSTLSENGDGPFLAMEGALKHAGLTIDDIQYVNTHGTATENNDEVESKALIRLFNNEVPPFSSSKSNIGHTLAASGTIEAIHCIFMLKYQEIYKSLNFKNPIPATQLIPQQSYSKMSVTNVMSNAFGFGGNCSSLILTKA